MNKTTNLTYVYINQKIKIDNIVLNTEQRCVVIGNRGTILLIEYFDNIQGKKITKEVLQYSLKPRHIDTTIKSIHKIRE